MEQKFYYEFKNNKIIMYLCDTIEGYITIIPDEYEGLYKHLKGSSIGSFITLEYIIDEYNLKFIEFDDLNKEV